MKLTEIEYTEALPIDGYGPGYFRVGGQLHDGPMLMSNAGPKSWGGLQDDAALLELAGDVDVVFFGMGSEISHLPKDLNAKLDAAGLGVEVMNSPAACRTYNVLLSEGRRVALAVLPV